MDDKNNNIIYEVSEPVVPYTGFVHMSEDEKLLQDVLRPDLEKLQLFTRMIKRNAMLNKAVVSNNLVK